MSLIWSETTMIRRIVLVCALLVNCLCLESDVWAQQEANKSVSATPVKIGFVLPLSGDWAFLGEGVRDAALLAEQDLSDAKLPFQLLFEDNNGQLKQSASAAYRLINVEKVDAIISIISGVGLLINPIAEKAKVLNFGLCSNVNVADGTYNFTNYITTEEGARSFLQELARRGPGSKAKSTKLGVFSLNEEGFNQILEQVEAQSAGTTVDIIFKETFEPQTRDFRSQIMRSVTKEPDTLLVLGLSPEIETLAKQLEQLQKTVPLASIEAFGLAENKSAFNGAWYIDAAAPSEVFQKRFKSSYGREITAAAAHAYDTVMVIAQAAIAAAQGRGNPGTEKPTTTEIAKAIHSVQRFEGVVGSLTVDENGVIHSVPSVKVMTNGRGVLLQSTAESSS